MSKHDVDYNDKNAYLFLCCHDVFERLDTLILEIRHIQKNIIYVLRTPELYQPLHAEEEFIWFNNEKKPSDNADIWSTEEQNFKSHITSAHNSFSKDVNYPDPAGLHKDNSTPPDNEDPHFLLLTIVKAMFMHGIWNNDQQAHYRNLYALQRIKQEIVLDKVYLCNKTFDFFTHCHSDYKNEQRFGQEKVSNKIHRQRARLLILRTVILAKARQYVARVGDHQALLARAEDYGLQDHPRPNFNRRHYQHLYDEHLADRCRDVHKELVLLEKDALKLNTPDENHESFIFHRWEHTDTSHWYASHTNQVKPNGDQTFYNINTSYWMPDRPDLQSVIDHEIAHTHIEGRFQDFLWLENDTSDFANFLKHCTQAINCYLFYDDNGAQTLRRELTADLFAASVSGPRYLYALFLELLGYGLETLVAHPTHDEAYDLDGLLRIEQGINSEDIHNGHSHLRLIVIAHWLEKIYPDKLPNSELVNRLTTSVRSLCDDLFQYLEKYSQPGSDQNTVLIWSELSDRLCQIIDDSPSVTNYIKTWITDRANDQYKQLLDKGEYTGAWENGPHKFPHSSRRLLVPYRNLLTRLLGEEFDLRFNKSSIDGNKKNDYYENIYGLPELKNAGESHEENPHLINCPKLFARLSDIPWQYALLRALDFVHPNSAIKPADRKVWLTTLHNDTHMGRDLYLIGLELYLSDYSTPAQRLADCRGWAKSWISTLEKIPKSQSTTGDNDAIAAIKGQIDGWLIVDPHGDISKFIETIDSLEKENPKPKTITKKYSKAWKEVAKSYGTETLIELDRKITEYCSQNNSQNEITYNETFYQRRLARAQGFKLDDLYKILGEAITSLRNLPISTESQAKNKNIDAALGMAIEMYEFLSHRAAQNIDTHMQNVCKIFSLKRVSCTERQNNPAIHPSLLTLIRRFYLAGQYSLSFLKDDKIDDNKLMRSDFPHAPTKYTIENKVYWNNNNLPIKNIGIEHYACFLGRQDVIAIAPSSPLSRCWIPDLPHKITDKEFELAKTLGQDLTEMESRHKNKYFSSFFERREEALRLNFIPEKKEKNDSPENPRDWKPLALLSVSIRQVTMRVDFVTRLFRALHGEYVAHQYPAMHSPQDEPKYLKDLHDLIPRNSLDFYLCDGLADIVIIFLDDCTNIEDRYERLLKIFQFQQTLFEDFQVDRTELMLAPACADAITHLWHENKKDFSLRMSVRLLEDRFNSGKNTEFVDVVKKLPNKDIEITLNRTPGLLDFSLDLSPQNSKSSSSTDKATYTDLAKILFDDRNKDLLHLDRFQTTIGLTISREDKK